MALIDEIITDSNSDLVLSQIGAIIKLELESQKTKQALTDDINVFNSRIHRYNSSEQLMFNVLMDNIDNNIYNSNSNQPETIYFIDCFASSSETSNNVGGLNATLKLNKYVGMIKYILSNSRYNTLGLAPGAIRGCYVKHIQFYHGDPSDSEFTKEARIQFMVKVNDNLNTAQGGLIEGTDTEVKLDLTDLGYKYECNI